MRCGRSSFSVDSARDDAWLAANITALQPSTLWSLTVSALDKKAAFLGRLISRPVGPVASVVALIRNTESTDTDAVITALNRIVQP